MNKILRNRLNKSEYDDGSMEDQDQEQSDGHSVNSGRSKKSRKLTAKRYWTRILSVCYRPIDYEQKFDIDNDLDIEEINYADLEEEDEVFTAPIFTPGTFFNLDKPMEVQAYKLQEEDLKAWAIRATQIRATFAKRAAVLEQEHAEAIDGAV